MRSHTFTLLCWLSLLLAIQVGRGRGRGYHRGNGRADHRGGYRGGYDGYGRGYGGYRRPYGGYGRGYGGRQYAGRNGGDHGGHGPPPPPPDECTPPCYRTYGVPGHEKCVCMDTTIKSSTTTCTNITIATSATSSTTPSTTTTPTTTPIANSFTSPTTSPTTFPTTSPSTSSTTPTTTSPSTSPSISQTTSPTTSPSTSSTASSTTSLTMYPTTSSTTSATTALSFPTTTPRSCEPGPPCRDGFEPFGRRCWRMTSNPNGTNVNAEEAKANCASHNSTLASIRNKVENDFVTNLTRTGQRMTYFPPADWAPEGSEVLHVHIGAFVPPDSDVPDWKWIDGMPFSWSNWANVPELYPADASERNGAILPDLIFDPGVWNNINGSLKARAGVCAYDMC